MQIKPEQASEIAPKVDWIIWLLTYLSVFFTVIIVGAMLYFAFKYRRRNGVDHETPAITGSHSLEVIWTVVPTIICIIVGYYGIVIYQEMRFVPDSPDLVTVNARGQMWNWEFEYDNGRTTKGELVVPVDRPVKVVLTSRDVLHSFFIPAMRVKSDAIPGRYTYVTFRPVKSGVYQAFCTEYCGKEHSRMLAKVRVVPQEEYTRWVNDRSEEFALQKLTRAERGEILYTQKGCNACHSLNGTRLVGPTFLKIYGHEATYDGQKPYVADANYLKESILYPNKHIVDGYPPNLMPSYEGQLNDSQIEDMIAWMRTLTGEAPPAPAAVTEAKAIPSDPAEHGKLLYASYGCNACHSLDGNKGVGPSFKGSFGAVHEMADGAKITVDEAYLNEAIVEPTAKVVAGYQAGVMPKYPFKDGEVDALVAFIKTVK